MKKALVSHLALVGLFCFATEALPGGPVEYVKICNIYGDGFHYIPGTDVCMNTQTGDTRQQTEGGTWRTLLPYPEGEWVKNLKQDCRGKLVKVGTFESTDFTLNAWNRKETPPFDLELQDHQFITKVIMSGGFYDPRVPSQGGSNTGTGLCLRSKDPDIPTLEGDPEPIEVTWGNGGFPIGCITNSRIVNMPAAYSVAATAAYPQIFSYFPGPDQTVTAGPYEFGSQLVVTTDIGISVPDQLTYFDAVDETTKPLAGSLSVWVCVEPGKKAPALP